MRFALLFSALFGLILGYRFNLSKYIKNECKLLPPSDELNIKLQNKVNQARKGTNETRLIEILLRPFESAESSDGLQVSWNHDSSPKTRYKNKNKVSQFLSGKHGKIPKNPPVSVGKVQQIPFGCIWGEKEASCIFITGKFIKFLRNFVDFVDVPLISIVSEDLEKLNNTELSSNNSKISSNSSLPNVLKKL